MCANTSNEVEFLTMRGISSRWAALGRDYGRQMTSSLVAVSFESPDVGAASEFWAALLGREILTDGAAAVLPGDDTEVGLRFVPERTRKPETNRLHLHVTSTTVEDQRQIVADVLRLGGRRRGSGVLPIGRDIYVNDPGGDEFCIIEPGNSFLAGCGFLAEVTCEGTPTAGRFWLDALGWRLDWDQDGQFVIQSPAGGTKLSWDGEPSADAPTWNRQRFVLTATDASTEADRLARLGATPVSGDEHAILMSDPDGSEFLLLHR